MDIIYKYKFRTHILPFGLKESWGSFGKCDLESAPLSRQGTVALPVIFTFPFIFYLLRNQGLFSWHPFLVIYCSGSFICPHASHLLAERFSDWGTSGRRQRLGSKEEQRPQHGQTTAGTTMAWAVKGWGPGDWLPGFQQHIFVQLDEMKTS